ncbi:hypothetical protein BASA82_000257 [Batrachochytrium salamandrivorans]|nr:hypothetical protein BASA82_000257 [Batrachochytrium salamandrivorans]
MTLSFATIPLLLFTSSERKMDPEIEESSHKTMTTKTRTVLVVGAGYAGLEVCLCLQQDQSIQLILVDARQQFMLHKMSALRAATVGSTWIDKTLIPSNKLKRVKFVQGKLVKIHSADNFVVLHTGEEIHYDYIVLCTGARNFSPAEPPLSITTRESTVAYFTRTQAAIAKANKIVIYGAGLVGIELAGEILHKYAGNKSVLLVKPQNHSLLGGVTLNSQQEQSMLDLLSGTKHLLYLPDEQIKFPPVPTGDWSEASPLVEMGDSPVVFQSGKQLEDCDLIAGTFQVHDTPNAFALGDVAKTGHAKLASMHMADAKEVANNIKRLVAGQEPIVSTNLDLTESFAPPVPKGQVLVSFGPSKGRTFWMGSGTTSGNWFTWAAKSRHLFVGYIASRYRH